MNTTTKIREAASVLKGDWDRFGTVSVYLPADSADALLRKLGWTECVGMAWRGYWSHPDHQYRCDAGEALQLALIGETV